MYLPEKDWEVHISVCSLSAEAWGRATVSLCGPTKSGFFVYYRLVSLVHASPIWLSHLGVWGTHLSDEVLEVARCWVQIICSSERSRGVVSSLPIIIMVSGVGFIMRVYLRLSHPFWCKYFLICPKCFSASFWISSRRFFSMYRYRFGVSVGGGEFWRLLCHHFGLEFLSRWTLSQIYKGKIILFGEVYQKFKEKLITILFKFFQSWRRRKHFPTHFTSQHYPDSKTRRGPYKERKSQAKITAEHGCNSLNKMLANQS